MSPRNFTILWVVALISVSFVACDVGQGVKTLGKKAVGNTGTGATDADSFSVTLAFRDPASDASTPIRSVSIQGVRSIPSANLVNECGTTGQSCTCEFFRGTNDTSPAVSTVVGISAQNNSYSCTIPDSITNAEIKTPAAGRALVVRLKRVDDATRNTGFISIKSTLSIGDVLGSTLVKTKVRGVFRYKCTRTFFEGEGVSPSQITCAPGQHLGVIGAEYNFYTFRSGEDSNTSGGDSAFPADICKRNSFLKIQCTGNTPDLRYGLYKDNAEPFTIGIQMTRAPEGDNLTAVYGFAALPDSAGNCPTGLVKIRRFQAQPGSIIPTGPSCPAQGCPSSFINTNNTLNNTVVEQAAPSNFIVTRQPNVSPCAVDGDCTAAAFGGQVTAQSVAYAQLTPVLCAIPPELLNGLF